MKEFTRLDVYCAIRGAAGVLWLALGGWAAAGQTGGQVKTPAVEPIRSERIHGDTRKAQGKGLHRREYSWDVKTGGWVDTGVDVLAGEQAVVVATGQMLLADGRTVGPEGADRGWKDLLRKYPLNDAKAGALIGRVTDLGASVPFPLGASGKVTLPTSGRLFLAVNTPPGAEVAGEFKVKWTFVKADGAASPVAVQEGALAGVPAAGVPVQAGEVSALVSPATFANIPRRVADAQGNAGDMVNFALLGTQAQVEAAFKAAGWVAVDKSVEDAVLHGLMSTLSHEAYTEMPMSKLFLFGREQDLSFARGDPLEVAAVRHHLRVWKTDQTVGGMALWVGSATHDVGFEQDARVKDEGGAHVTHKIDPDIDLERQFLLQSFDTAGMFRSAAYVAPADPLREAHTATGGSFHSDGRILVMELK
jgi:hypothetical protein